MNTDYLKEFVHLAETLSFRETADYFYVSRSVISRHLSALEDAIGTRLVERDTRGVKLTGAGEVFYREAQTLLRDLDIAVERVRELQGESNKLVRIGYLRNGSRPFLVRYVNHMAETYPEIHLSLLCMDYQELRRAMKEHTVDIAVGLNVDPSISDNYRSTQIYVDRFDVMCSHSNPLAQLRRPLSLSDLRDQKLLVPQSYISAGLGSLVSQLVDEQNLTAAQAYYEDMDLLYLKIQTEGFVAFVSRLNAAVYSKYLSVIPLQGIDSRFTISAFYHDDFNGYIYEACKEGFEWCKNAIEGLNEASEL